MDVYVWLGIIVIAGIIEIATVSMITLWFVVGGFAAFMVALFTDNIFIQIIVFIVISILCLVFLRPLILKTRAKGLKAEPSNVGRTAVVIEEINNDLLMGRIETDDRMTWSAKSSNDAIIPAGSVVTVVGQESVKLIVELKA
ncbi:MAG: NfeD family protein [Eggerthellaceae bacterium]|nr:NfeD family protein [Eggerthellaceae bacterium]